ncbi:MAG: NTP transferase domain-containing protein, partial [Actinobacteria bacterium]|nr:NTP transferase domain-containing protein [Actinomycetota bacterium]
MKAVIMAGGEGTRLRPLTSNQPKPMIPVANRPMMEHIVRLLHKHGFDDIVVTVAFLANHIRTYFGDGSEFGVRMVYATEETPLGTAGSVRNAMDELDERFLVISGDVLTDIDLSKVVEFHEQRGALATIGLTAVENPLEFGIVITNDDGSIERFLEKPTWGQVFSDTVNNGIFMLEPEIFDFIAPDGPVDFSTDVFPVLLEQQKALYGYVCDGYWEDVGTVDAYARAHRDLLDGKVDMEIPGFQVEKGIWLGESVEIDPSAKIVGPAIVGDYTRIEPGARLGAYTVLGSNVMVGSDADVERSIIHDSVYMGQGVRIRGAVIGRSCDLRARASCDEDVVLGDDCFIGEQAVVTSGVKVYPFKTVEAGAVVNASLVWESKGARSLFVEHGVAGLANVDITPELATRVAMAYATTLKKGATVVTSRDASRSARMLKRSVMAGLNAAGVHVNDLEVAPVPTTRFQVRSEQAQGGISIRLINGDPQSVILRFFDVDGLDISEAATRKVERLFYREDFRRVFPGDIGDIGYPPRAIEHYTTAVTTAVDFRLVRQRHFKVVVDYSYGSTAFVMPNVLAKLGADVLAVNPFASTAQAISFDFATHAADVGTLVRSSGSQLGVVIDPGGEHLTLIDDEGRILSDTEAMLAFIHLIGLRSPTNGRIALPVVATAAAERLARSHGLEVVWAKLSTASLMEAVSGEDMVFGAGVDGGFIFPAFLPAFDATVAFISMLELLAANEIKLSQVVNELEPVHMAHETVATPWHAKGVVMRSLVEQADHELILVDG